MIHSNSVKNPTDINLDSATLDSPSGEDREVPSHSSRLIPEYPNLRISGLRRNKIIQERDSKVNGIPKVFGLIYLFTYVVMFITKSILPETESFTAKMLHYEERAKSSPENLPKFTNPLVSNIEEGNDALTFK